MSSSPKVVTTSSDRNGWMWGINPRSERWNGRLAMLGFVSILWIELSSGQGILHFWHVL